MNSQDKILAKRYARAYIDLTHIDASSARRRINRLEEIYASLRPYGRFLEHPVIPAGIKSEIVSRITQCRDAAYNFMLIIISKRHYALAEEIISCCHDMLDKAEGIVKARISSPCLLPENLVARLKKIISANPEKAQITQIADPSLIGGFELKFGDFLFDASIKGQLKRLEQEIEA